MRARAPESGEKWRPVPASSERRRKGGERAIGREPERDLQFELKPKILVLNADSRIV